ncbi:hypothetical protein FOTG_19033 [Fusarium oxysporum f. sp. vasinfectum 25433]|uniref:Uncharacterized protein n=1 Tax=Fusarium oxysporum f. sp. vasinfectum 25433 TaxID=1089449 RepID=X0KUW5_FUSOX|nr:hypothetical protein FOTG_19033 [Fusarium oxysporum f. sp. vasinfectum 25433]
MNASQLSSRPMTLAGRSLPAFHSFPNLQMTPTYLSSARVPTAAHLVLHLITWMLRQSIGKPSHGISFRVSRFRNALAGRPRGFGSTAFTFKPVTLPQRGNGFASIVSGGSGPR